MIDYSRLPEHMQGAARRYIENGISGGSFLTEVFSNRLVQAYGRADDQNTAAMRNWADFLYNEAPRGCWGSPELVDEWCRVGGLVGLNVQEEI